MTQKTNNEIRGFANNLVAQMALFTAVILLIAIALEYIW